MVRHNNVVPNQHFHKKWDRRVKTWLNQPAQKRVRREARKQKAAAVAPAPASGALRPLVHCPTQKYNSKVRLGRGFSVAELKAAKLSPKYAQTVGIAVDLRRTNKSQEALDLNVARLEEYKTRLVVFKNNSEVNVPQLKGDVAPKTTKADAVSFIQLTPEMQNFAGYRELRAARNDAKLVGKRLKALKAKEAAKEEA